MVEGRGGGKLADERRREFFTVSLFLSTRIERSCGNRAYLTYGGPAFGIIYGREGLNRSQKKRCPLPSLRANISLSPSSHRVRENLDRNAVSPTTRDLDRERECTLVRVEFVNEYISVVANSVSKVGWNSSEELK